MWKDNLGWGCILNCFMLSSPSSLLLLTKQIYVDHLLLVYYLLLGHVELLHHSLCCVSINDKHTHVLGQQLGGVPNVDGSFWNEGGEDYVVMLLCH